MFELNPRSTNQTLTLRNFILKMLSPLKWYVVFLFSFALIWALDTALRPFLIKIIIDRLSTTPQSMAFHTLAGPLTLFVILSLFTLVGYRFYDFLIIRVLPAVRKRVLEFLHNHLLYHSHTYYLNHFAGSLGARMNDMATGLREVITIFVDRFTANGLAVTMAIIAISFIHWLLGVILFVWFILFLIGSYYTSKKAHDLSGNLSAANALVIGKIVDTFSNMSAVRLFNGEKIEKKILTQQSKLSIQQEERLLWFLFKIWLFQGLSFFITEVACILVLTHGFQHGWVTVGDFGFVLTLYLQLIGSLWNLSRDFSDFSEHLGRISEGLRMITSAHEIKDVPNAQPLTVTQGEIRFEDVRFHYKTDHPLFHDLSLTLRGGEKVGLVGFSGSGKTTCANLIVRLYNIQRGRILIDDQDISHVTLESLRDHIAMIPQEPSLFHRSIYDNILYGRSDATTAEVFEAAQKAHIHDFILSLPEGYDTLLGERGVKISGGQRQRIAIARAILKNAPILILDEATSALDSVTEQSIQEALDTLMQQKTTLVIAHRLSTLLTMDRILVFEKGRVVEDGTHRELLKKNGLYARLWSSQVSGFLPDKQEENVP
ncbi:MAG: ABC transporter ATP-binding protein [Candidatus Nucleicultricaceae bacterium]